jgi:hypothetical protein
MFKLNRWALSVANTVAAFHIIGMAALYIWGEKAITFVEKFQIVKFSQEALTLQITPANFITGTIVHYVFAYAFVAVMIFFHDHIKGK